MARAETSATGASETVLRQPPGPALDPQRSRPLHPIDVRQPMIGTPLISVLMTSYNREDFISEAVESVLAQTCGNFELIVSDDCSTDRTLDIVRSYASKDSRIRISVNERNLGDYRNRNRAASLAR